MVAVNCGGKGEELVQPCWEGIYIPCGTTEVLEGLVNSAGQGDSPAVEITEGLLYVAKEAPGAREGGRHQS